MFPSDNWKVATMTAHDHSRHSHKHDGSCCAKDESMPTKSVTRDPVCGMTVDPNAGKPQLDHGGHVYHFCSAECYAQWRSDEDRKQARAP